MGRPRGPIHALIDCAIDERRTVLAYRRLDQKKALRRQGYASSLIHEGNLPAVASMRRVGDEWRVYVMPFDEDDTRTQCYAFRLKN